MTPPSQLTMRLRSPRKKRVLAVSEEDLLAMTQELRELLSRTASELEGELTAADYARLGSLWVRITEAAIKCEQHRAREAERKAQALKQAAGGTGQPPEELSPAETQLNLF